MKTKRTTTLAGLGLAAVLLASACGSDGGDQVSTASSVGSVASSQLEAAKAAASSLLEAAKATASSQLEAAKETASSVVAGTQKLDGEWKLGLDVLGVDTSGGLQPTITFAGNEVSGFSGCNNYVTTATIEGNALTLGQIAGTKKACEPAATKVETAYLERLAKTTSFVVAADRLVLMDASRAPVLVFAG